MDCRLGNQLFQYAFIKAISEKFGTSFFINEKAERFILPEFFNLAAYHPFTNKINKLILKMQQEDPLRSMQNINIGEFTAGIEDIFQDKAIYKGYFQSELFFKNISDRLTAYITVKEKYTEEFNKKYLDMFRSNRTVTVHVRRGDYLNLNDWWAQNMGSNNLTLPTSYYLNCLSQITEKKSYKIIFISDDIDFVRSEFSHIENAEFSGNDIMTDFQLLMNADIGIISQSSFAWWAAYLNPKANKKIFCPENWLGFKVNREYPAHIIPAGWEKVAV